MISQRRFKAIDDYPSKCDWPGIKGLKTKGELEKKVQGRRREIEMQRERERKRRFGVPGAYFAGFAGCSQTPLSPKKKKKVAALRPRPTLRPLHESLPRKHFTLPNNVTKST